MKITFFIFTFLIIHSSFGQTQLPPTIAIGIAARQGPLDFTNYNKPIQSGGLVPADPDLSYIVDAKPRFTLDIAMQVFKKSNIKLQLSSFFTTAPLDHNGAAIEKKRFKRDHFLDAYYPITGKRKRLILIAGIGLGVINCGTKSYYIVKEYDVNTNTIFTRSFSENFRFFSPKLIFGVQKNRVTANVNINGTPDRTYKNKLGSIAFEFKTTYTIRPFHKEHYKLAFKKIPPLK